MTHLLRHRTVSLLGLLAGCAVIPGATLHFFGETKVEIPSAIHFFAIGTSAGLAAAAAFALTVAGARRGDARSVLIGTAFSSMAALLAIHGLTTPGFLVGDNGLVAFSGAATLPVGGAVLALSAIPELRRPSAVRPVIVLQGVLLAVIVSLGAVGILAPSVVPSVPEAASVPAYIVLAFGVIFYAALAARAARTFLLTRRSADLVVVYGLVLLAIALYPGLVLEYYELGWWMGHGFELIGLGMVGVPVALDLHRGAQSRPLVGDLRASELVSAADAFMGPTVRALLVRLGDKDEYTAEHTRGVALRAVQVGEELGLAPVRLRELAIGGLVHDVGKLSVPNEILQKPGALTDEEYDVIKRHPELGSDLVRQLGFSAQVARLVLDHHERLDGSGYPRGLGAPALDIETRILAVCDVFDALLSRRVYRPAWTLDKALELLSRESGTAFDSACVEALERVIEREQDDAVRAAAA
ncbi:MAG TPA: HD-GYP domain-containing protein [Thermoleophilaceae bacterium]|nr:HD-GYP domain-containing protein [Thermoleophilaceae bacterium]